MSYEGNRFSLVSEVDEEEEDHFPSPKTNLLNSFSRTEHETSSNTIKVYLKIRPFVLKERNKNTKSYMKIEDGEQLTVTTPQDKSSHLCQSSLHKFSFSKIFPDDTSQKAFFNEAVLPCIDEFLHGQNSLVFTYGVTNSGKTFTTLGTAKDAGIVPRSLDVLFNSIEHQQLPEFVLKPMHFDDVQCVSESDKILEKLSKDSLLRYAAVNFESSSDSSVTSEVTSNESLFDDAYLNGQIISRNREGGIIELDSSSKTVFSVWISFAEIYNEYVYDLLEPLAKRKGKNRIPLVMREDKNGSPFLRGLKEICVGSADEAVKLLAVGRKNLQVASTYHNQFSSRSHCVFTIKMIRTSSPQDTQCAHVNTLSFCDLAGAERYTKVPGTDQRMKEAGNINSSLLTLGRCIDTMRKNQESRIGRHVGIVPFRDSKLTRLFQNFFIGNGKAVMIVNVNQLSSMFDETLHVLKYSAIARKVVTNYEKPNCSFKVPKNPMPLRKVVDNAARKSTSIGSINSSKEEFEALENLVSELKNELREQQFKQLSFEARIRAEVTDEATKHISEIEKSYQEFIKDAEISAEINEEERIELLLASQKKSRKRKKCNEESSEEEIGDKFLREQIKVLKSNVSDLKSKSEMKEKELQQEVRALQFEQASQQSKVKDLMEEREDLDTKLKQTIEERSELVDEKDLLDAKVNELDEMLDQAGVVLEQRNVAIEEQRIENLKLKDHINDQYLYFKEHEDATKLKLCEIQVNENGCEVEENLREELVAVQKQLKEVLAARESETLQVKEAKLKLAGVQKEFEIAKELAARCKCQQESLDSERLEKANAKENSSREYDQIVEKLEKDLAESKTLNKELKESQKNLAHKQDDVTELKLELMKTKSALCLVQEQISVRNTQDNLSAIKAKLELVELDRCAETKEKEALQEKLEITCEELMGLKGSLQELDECVFNLETKLKDTIGEKEVLQNEIMVKSSIIKSLEEDIEIGQSGAEKRITELVTKHELQLKEIEESLQDKSRIIEKDKCNTADLGTKLAEAEEMLKMARDQNETLLQQLSQKESICSVMETMKQALEEQEATMTKQDEVLWCKEVRIKDLEDDQCNLARSADLLRMANYELKVKFEKSEDIVKQHEERIVGLEDELNKRVKTQCAECKIMKAELEKVKRETQNEKGDLERQMNNIREDARELSAEVVEVERSLRDVKNQLVTREEELLQKEESMKKWRANRDKLAKELETIVNRKDEEIACLREMNEMKKEDVSKEHLQQLEKTISAKDVIIDELKKLNSALQAQMSLSPAVVKSSRKKKKIKEEEKENLFKENENNMEERDNCFIENQNNQEKSIDPPPKPPRNHPNISRKSDCCELLLTEVSSVRGCVRKSSRKKIQFPNVSPFSSSVTEDLTLSNKPISRVKRRKLLSTRPSMLLSEPGVSTETNPKTPDASMNWNLRTRERRK